MTVVNAFTASDEVIVPVQAEYLSLRGLVQQRDAQFAHAVAKHKMHQLRRDLLRGNRQVALLLPALVVDNASADDSVALAHRIGALHRAQLQHQAARALGDLRRPGRGPATDPASAGDFRLAPGLSVRLKVRPPINCA